MIAFVSHLVADTFTERGVPWLFPIPINFGIPPIKALRLPTGGFREKYIVFPGFLLLNAYIFYHHYNFYLDLLRRLF